MSHAYYRKWRPRTFDQVVGQEHVTQTLRNAVQESRFVHAYLFAGPRGCGKTSTARILAKAVNCLTESDERPCNQCHMCQAIDEGRAMDLIEIDAASHTGVDDIRDLRDRISFSPAEARYKCYIVDEVHMLSSSAFNALLKTLEEPPAHAILILATTEPHKIPATVLSRCQRFDFRPIPLRPMVDRLRAIASEEGLEVQDGAFDLIARQSTGSMRDAESLLDQVASSGGAEITLDQVQTMLGTTSSQAVKELVDHLASRDVAAGLSAVGRAVAEGADPRQLNKDLLGYLRGLLLVKTIDRAPSDLTEEQQSEMARQANRFSLQGLVRTIRVFSQAALDLRTTTQPQLPLELAVAEAILDGEADSPADRTASAPQERKPAARPREQSAEAPTPTPPTREDPPEEQTLREQQPTVRSTGVSQDLAGLQEAWNDVVARINGSNKHIAAIVRDCPPVALEHDVVTLRARSTFHKEKLESDRARTLVEQAMSEALGTQLRVKCALTPEAPLEDSDKRDLQRLAEDPLIKAALERGGQIGAVQ